MKVYKINGVELPSVTSILKETEDAKDKDRLRKWQQKMDKVMGVGGSEIIANEAAERGTLLHERIEGTWNKKEWLETEAWSRLKVDEFWRPIERWVYGYQGMVMEWERTVISEKLGYAGTLDLIANTDPKSAKGYFELIDFKTSKREKLKSWCKNHFLQCAAYAIAYQEQTGKRINEIKVVIASPGKMQIFSEPIWLKYEEEWLERLKAFKERVI